MDRRFERRRTANDWVIAIIQGFDANKGFGPSSTRIVPGPLTERTFLHRFTGKNLSLDNDLGIGRKMKASHRPLDNVDRLINKAARPIVFVHTKRHRL